MTYTIYKTYKTYTIYMTYTIYKFYINIRGCCGGRVTLLL